MKIEKYETNRKMDKLKHGFKTFEEIQCRNPYHAL